MVYRRLGEATNPGPDDQDPVRTALLIGNVTSLAARWSHIVTWGADGYLLQESRLGVEGQRQMRARMRDAGLDAAFGRPMAMKDRAKRPGKRDRRQSIWNVQEGGVATLGRVQCHLTQLEPLTPEAVVLFDSGRWVSAALPIGSGAQQLVCKNYYGVPNARTDALSYAENERLIHLAFIEAASHGDVPVMVAGDMNVQVHESPALQRALASGRWYDVAAELTAGDPPATYNAQGVTEYTPAEGSTRIDLIFANSAAMARICAYRPRYGLDCPKHLVQQVDLRVDAYAPMVRIYAPPAEFSLDLERLREQLDDTAPIHEGLRQRYWEDLRTAIDDCRPIDAWKLWHDMAEDFLDYAQDLLDVAPAHRGQRGRGCAPRMEVKKLEAPVNARLPELGATTHFINDLENLQRRARELELHRRR